MSKLSIECIKGDINKIKEDMTYNKAEMEGFFDDLIKIKKDLEEIFDKRFFYLGYSLSDAYFFGWKAEKLKNMKQINTDIQQKFYELYAIVLKATDSEVE